MQPASARGGKATVAKGSWNRRRTPRIVNGFARHAPGVRLAKSFKTAGRGPFRIDPMAHNLSSISPALQPLLASAQPSRTALLCGIARARHQLLDGGEVFADPLALEILGPELGVAVRQWAIDHGPGGHLSDRGSFSEAMRGALAARSTRGGTAPEQVAEQITGLTAQAAAHSEWASYSPVAAAL